MNDVEQKIQTVFGKKVRLDFLAGLTNNVLINVEAHRGPLNDLRLIEYFFYLSVISAYYGGDVRQLIIRFCKSTVEDIMSLKINHIPAIFPDYFYIGDIDFDEIISKINKKVQIVKSLIN